MKKSISAIRLTITRILNAGLGVFTVMGVPPTLQAGTEIDLVQIQRIDDIRLRLREYDWLIDENQSRIEDRPEENRIAGLDNIPNWPNWSDWGNGWRNY